MNKSKVLSELGEWTADPLDSKLAMHLIDSIQENKPMGRIVMRLLEFAENGNFK